MNQIKLSIQEIVNDFEKLTREDERLTTLSDYELIIEKDFEEYHKLTKNLCEKYIPNWKEIVPTTYKKENLVEKGIILHSILHKNFKEIIFQLI